MAENVLQLAQGLGAHGWEVELAGPDEAIIYGEAEAAGVPIHRIDFARGYGAPARDARAFRGLRALLRAGGYDLLHCHSAKAGVVGRLAARASRVPCVYTPHCFPFVGEFGTPRRIFATGVERALAPLAARTICVCDDEREIGVRAGLRADRLRVVRNGCDPCPNGFEPDPNLLALRDGGVVGAAVAVLRAQKRLDVLVDAAPEVLRRLPDARLAIVGDGPLRDELHERARANGLDAEPRFAFLPFGAPAARHLRAADVYVLPSGWEALPIGVLEALACGVPQIATDVGGTGEAVSPETGVLVPPGDPAALAEALVGLLGDPARREAMAQASVERMVAETAAVYAETLGRT